MKNRCILLAIFLTLACIGDAQCVNLAYDDSTRKEAPPLSMFFDRAGDLYPPGDVPVNVEALLDVEGQHRSNARQSSREYATLKSLYRWEWGRKSPAWIALSKETGVDADVDFDEAWPAVQRSLRGSATGRLLRAHDTHVVLLIHGFNTSAVDASRWYQIVEDSIRESHGDKIAFVRVYWDGLAGFQPLIWSKAQFNGPYVGLGLRRILNALPEDYPLRVITHSSGAFVMTNVLGDGTGAFNIQDLEEDYLLRAGSVPTYEFLRIRDLRVAMLAPAQPTTAYSRFSRNGRLERGIAPSRLILGTSARDIVTSKLLGICKMAGATCMATRPKSACHQVSADLNMHTPSIQVVNFPKRSVVGVWHPHGVKGYMADVDDWSLFIASLFQSEPLDSTLSAKYC